jgi:hypothetical protein
MVLPFAVAALAPKRLARRQPLAARWRRRRENWGIESIPVFPIELFLIGLLAAISAWPILWVINEILRFL